MPNWTEQQLHVVGTKADIDRFMRAGYTRRGKGSTDALLHFDVLCPPERRAEQRDEPADSGVVLIHQRTRTQACFDMISAWDYPADFYAALATEWPTLSFCCSVAGEMGDFGGLIVHVGESYVDLVEDFDQGYDRRAHLRTARAALKRWMAFLTSGRDWRINSLDAWNRGALPVDAQFDGDFWFYFSSREEMATFRARYPCDSPQRRVHGEWKRTR